MLLAVEFLRFTHFFDFPLILRVLELRHQQQVIGVSRVEGLNQLNRENIVESRVLLRQG